MINLPETVTRDYIMGLEMGAELNALVAQSVFDFDVVALDFPIDYDWVDNEWRPVSQVTPNSRGGWDPFYVDAPVNGVSADEPVRGAIYVQPHHRWPPQLDAMLSIPGRPCYWVRALCVPHYSESDREALQIDSRMEHLHVRSAYVKYLRQLTWGSDTDKEWERDWRFLNASGLIRCQAALLTQLERVTAWREMIVISEEMGYD